LHEAVSTNGDPSRRIGALEKLDAEFRLQRLDLVAHSPRRDGQLFGDPGETLMACRALKSLKAFKRCRR
jgi:hypothetical protein